jgi:hypothetical protein
MNLHRPSRTFADYTAVAVCPVLIMLAVGSLVFFLVEIGYAGSQLGKLRWTLFWFVLAMVLVSRIAIEKGSEHAGVYGVGLAAATAIMLSLYVGNHLGVWLLLGLIWWATNKLTWDCTVIDDDQDASGEGLLQATKLDPQGVPPAQNAIPGENSPNQLVQCSSETGRDAFHHVPMQADSQGRGGTRPYQHSDVHGEVAGSLPPVPERKPPAKSKPAKPSWWKAMFGKRSAGASQPHAPGLWVIYFSLGALPVFGLGQGLFPVQDVAGRRYGFILLCVYLAAVLGLLLLTSFLGLRRYLRQRHLKMPPAMAATWVTTGSVVAVGILVGCILLPRPNADWSLTAMIDRLGDRPRESSQESKDEGQQEGSKEFESSERQAGAQTEGESQQGRPAEKLDRKKESPSAARASERVKPQATPAPPALPPSPRAPLRLLRIALYAVLVLLVLIVTWKYKERLFGMLREFCRALRDFWRNLFASRQAGPQLKESGDREHAAHPFAAFSNPFASGEAGRMSLQELIVYSFNGLEAWATERRCGRRPDQTPFEFSELLGEQVPELAFEVRQVTRLYVQVAFAKASSPAGCEPVLEALWNKMNSTGLGLEWLGAAPSQ